MREFMKKAASLLCLAVLFLMLGGCQMIRSEEENKIPLAYTVIEDSQIPEEMQELIAAQTAALDKAMKRIEELERKVGSEPVK